MAEVQEVSTFEHDGDERCEIFLPDRRVILFVDKTGRMGWAIASKPPHARDGSGYLERPADLFKILERGLS